MPTEEIYELAKARNKAVYGWLRWLVLLAAGFFSVMAGQVFGKNIAEIPLIWVKAAFLFNAAGILCGATALHGEPYSLRLLVKQKVKRLIGNNRAADSDTRRAANVAPVSKIHIAAEYICYVALATALLCWCVVVLSI